MVYLQARGLDFFQRLRFGRPLSMHACMLRSELFRAFRDATVGGYFALVELRLSRCRHADELRGGRNAGRSIISLRRFGAAYVLRGE
jgi:hypothetical protein